MRVTHPVFAYGGIGHLGRSGSPGPNHRVSALSAALHAELKDALSDETDIDIEYRTKPVISLAFTDEEVNAVKANMAWQELEIGTPARWADLQDVLEIEPRINPAAIGAVVTEGNTNLHPQRLTLALARVAERQGMTIRTATVTGLRRERGQVTAVTLADGEISASRVVLAAGPWMGLASEWLGVDIPVEPLKGQILRLWAPGPPVSRVGLVVVPVRDLETRRSHLDRHDGGGGRVRRDDDRGGPVGDYEFGDAHAPLHRRRASRHADGLPQAGDSGQGPVARTRPRLGGRISRVRWWTSGHLPWTWDWTSYGRSRAGKTSERAD